MSDRLPAFPLRLRDPKLRALVREVAQREGISQNELIETAVADEMVLRGRLLAEELSAAVDRLAELSDAAYAGIVARSDREFAAGEGRPDPLATLGLHRHAPHTPFPGASDAATAEDPLGVLAAFHAGRR